MTSNTPAESQAKTPRPASMYVRMSTEHQQFSTENQAKIIREYAERRGYPGARRRLYCLGKRDEERPGGDGAIRDGAAGT